MELIKYMQNRRSIRKYKDEQIPEGKLEMILQAGLLSESGRTDRAGTLSGCISYSVGKS